jgi:hypothetical protein
MIAVLLSLSLFAAPSWQKELIRFDCSGKLTVGDGFPLGPASIGAAGFPELLRFFFDEIVFAQKCGVSDTDCDALTDEQIERAFLPFSPRYLFQLLSGKNGVDVTANADGVHWPTDCDASLFSIGNHQEEFEIDFPSDCTEEACNVGLSMVGLDATFGLQVAACEDLPSPFVSLSCVGDDCVNIAAPCTANADCGTGLKCAELIKPASTCYKLELSHDPDYYNQQSNEYYNYDYDYDYYYDYYNTRHSPWDVKRTRTFNLEKCRVPGNFDFRTDAKAEPSATGCAFVPGDHLPEGAPTKLPVGFEYYQQADAESDCLKYTCDETGDWVNMKAEGEWQCEEHRYQTCVWDDETDECIDHSTFPFTYQNTYNIHYFDRAIQDGTAWRPMLAGSTYYLSSSQRELADFFSLARGDDPFECVTTDDLGFEAWSMVRELFDAAGTKNAEANGTPAPKTATLSLTGVLGICLPAATSWTLTSDDEIDFPYETPEEALDAAFGVTCSAESDESDYTTVKCVDSDDTSSNAFEWPDAPEISSLASTASVVRETNPITTGATVIGHLGCDGTVVLHPGSDTFGMQLTVTGFLRFIHWLSDYHQDVQECRYESRHGQALSEQQYRNRFLAIDNLLYWLTDPVSRTSAAVSSDVGLAMPDWAVGGASNGEVEERLDLTHNDVDDSCTYTRWRNEGICAATFKGISSGGTLIEEDFFLNFYVSKCFEPTSGFEARVPEMYLECEGAGCRVLDGPIPCDDRDDCPSGWACHELNSDEEDEEYYYEEGSGAEKREAGEHQTSLRRLKAFAKRALGLVGNTASSVSRLGRTPRGAKKAAKRQEATDPPYAAGGNEYQGGDSYAVVDEEEGESATALGGLFGGLEPSEMCDNLSGDDVLARFLYAIAPGSPTWSEGKHSFCFIDFEYLDEPCDCNLLDPHQSRIDAWAEAQAEIDVPAVKLTQLYPWSAIASRADLLDGGASLAFVEGASEWLGARSEGETDAASTNAVATFLVAAAVAIAAL